MRLASGIVANYWASVMILYNYILISFRNLLRNRVFIGINLAGLAIAVAGCIMTYLVWRHNWAFDRHYEAARRVLYRVNMTQREQDEVKEYAYVPVPLGEMLRGSDRYTGTVIRFSSIRSALWRNDEEFTEWTGYVDPDFFTLFPFEFLSGSARALQQPSALLISASLSEKLFNTTDAVGKTVELSISGALKSFEVGGVFRNQPAQSSFARDMFVSYTHMPYIPDGSWNLRYNNLFITVDDGGQRRPIEQELQSFIPRFAELDAPPLSFTLVPFDGMAQRDSAQVLFGVFTNAAMPQVIVIALAVMSLLILAVACFNLANTLVVLAMRRLREIGLRKVIGAARRQLLAQFVGESVMLCLLAVLLALPVCELMIAGWNLLWPTLKIQLTLTDDPSVLVFMTAVALITGTLSALYPAYHITRFQPAEALKGKVETGSTGIFTQTLLGLQFTASVLAIFFSVVFYQNLRFQQRFQLGYLDHGVFVINQQDSVQFTRLRQALEQHPGIERIAGTQDHLLYSNNFITLRSGDRHAQADLMRVGAEYISVMEMRLLDGRDFLPSDGPGSVIITEDLAQELSLSKPLDQLLMLSDTVPVYVVGVMAPVYASGTGKKRRPMILQATAAPAYNMMLVRAAASHADEVDAHLRKTWHTLFPHAPYSGQSTDLYRYASDMITRNITYVFAFLAVTAIVLSVAGLYSVVSLNIVRRTKEVGVRKVLGASVGQVMWSTQRRFVLVLLVAIPAGMLLAGSTVGFLLRLLWYYFEPAGVLTVIATAGIVLVLTAALIGAQVYRAAQMNPVLLLKTE
ncbi:ABC transporter permease [Parachryseolinea silvisoli]|uniref:ABC transporter permease n=1 Tax=Parachryseolinea silvisoli TaxID=2873601 RepID=UPI002265D853|nr:ABC transporter permease [Parachryseolinea silvisoli]MCD9020164.1 ABC transporter permease [Parachryseolinea silvisoli]